MAFASIIRGAAAALLLLASAAQAQDYPQKAIHLIVPYPPGGVTDLAARLVGQKLAEKWGQQVLAENRPGAGGIVGAEVTARAAPDGYTLMVTVSDFLIVYPTAYTKLPYNPDKDFVTVAAMSDTPLVLIASLKSGFKTPKDAIAAAKAKPGEIAFSSPGAGSVNQLAGEMFGSAAGAKLLHVPYRGGGPAATAVAGGEVPLGIAAISTVLPYVSGDKAKVIGLFSTRRIASVPDWPTLAEGGVQGLDASLVVGMWAPAGTKPAIVAKLHDEINRILATQEVRERLAPLGAEPLVMSTAEFEAKIKKDAARYGEIIRREGIHIE